MPLKTNTFSRRTLGLIPTPTQILPCVREPREKGHSNPLLAPNDGPLDYRLFFGCRRGAHLLEDGVEVD